MSPWGIFEIPEDLFDRTAWKKQEYHSGMEFISAPLPIPENWPFFKWLDEQEIKAGKYQ